MGAFDNVIGYKEIKEELKQICDMFHNREIYDATGARFPKGVLLYGSPGLGKTLMAQCFIEESGLEAFVVRKSKGNGDFIEMISESFEKAKENAPAIVFLDDIDKFANEDDDHRNAEEYVAVQAGIDEAKDFDVFVIATANDIHLLPDSITRVGRFDRKIKVKTPDEEDVSRIIEYYLSTKPVSEEICIEDLSKMFSFSSCAELEVITNEAAINAAYKRKKIIDMDDMVEAVLKKEYHSSADCAQTSEDEVRKTALHEAGHLVVSEVLEKGSVGLASVRMGSQSSKKGFVHRCKIINKRTYNILIALGGKAAVELYYAETVASGCGNDIDVALLEIRDAITTSGTCGLSLVADDRIRSNGQEIKARIDVVVRAELERYLFIARDILIKNKAFLENVTEELIMKKTLLYSDIQAIRDKCNITSISI